MNKKATNVTGGDRQRANQTQVLDDAKDNCRNGTINCHRVDVVYFFRLSRPACKEKFEALLHNLLRRQKTVAGKERPVRPLEKVTEVKFYVKGREARQAL